MRIIFITLCVLFVATVLTACAGKKVFYKDCEKIDNGWVCDED